MTGPPGGEEREMIRVVVADDHALVRGGFRMILEAQPDIEVVGEAANGLDAVALARSQGPDVVLMDVRMPELDGIEATRRVMSAPQHNVRVLMLTTFDLDEYVYRAMRGRRERLPAQGCAAGRTGARGARDRLRRHVAEPGHYPPPPGGVRRRPPPGERPAALRELTERESEVLGLVAQGLSNAEIAQRLFLGETTVKTHVTRVLSKLGLRDRVQAVVLAYESGLVRPGDDALRPETAS